MIQDFSIARLPRIEFGAGSINQLPTLARSFGKTILLVTGARSLQDSGAWPDIKADWRKPALTGRASPSAANLHRRWLMNCATA